MSRSTTEPTHPHLEGLIRKVRELAAIDRRQGGTVTSEFLAARLEGFANELEALAALPGGGVGGIAPGLSAHDRDRLGLPREPSPQGNPALHEAIARACASPTPSPPHEADRNGEVRG